MIVEDKITLSYDDLDIAPAVISEVDSRKQCNAYDENGMLPIFTAPMMTVINEHNFRLFKENKINVIIPRTVKYTHRVVYESNREWVAFSLNEFKKIFCQFGENEASPVAPNRTYKVLIDMADGHMHSLYKTTNIAKRK